MIVMTRGKEELEIDDDEDEIEDPILRKDGVSVEKRKSDDFVSKFDGIAFSIFGSYLKDKKDSFSSMQKKLDQSQMGISTDLFFSRILLTSFIVTFLTVLLLLVSIITLFSTGIISGIIRPIMLSIFVIAPIVFGISLSSSYLYPGYFARRRGKKIDKTMPHATTFMYALSRGGLSFINILRILSESEDTYGEVSREVQPIVNDMDFFSKDLNRAIRDASMRTPSQKFETFADDLINILDSGANLTDFLYEKSEEYMEEAEREQKNFIDMLSLLGEVYVTAFVAGPLFLIIITVVMTMLGGGATTQLYGIVYLLLPVMNIAFFILVDTITVDEGKIKSVIETEDDNYSHEEIKERFEDYVGPNKDLINDIIDKKKKRSRRKLFRDPISYFLMNPKKILYLTTPIAVVYFLFAFLIGLAEFNLNALIENPVSVTFVYFILPFFIMFIPLSLFHEIKTRRHDKMLQKLPDVLSQLAGSNKIGLTLVESLSNTAENTSGKIGKELRVVRNDVSWNSNVNTALIKFANRIKQPEISRTMKLITEANKSTGDIADVLEVAAKDVKQRQKLKREREIEMLMYTIVIIISFVVYLFVIAMLDSTFLDQIAQLEPSDGGGQGTTAGQAIDLSDVPVDIFRVVFFHSTIIQAIGSGILAGYLGANDPYKGLKYSIILITISLIAFTYIQ